MLTTTLIHHQHYFPVEAEHGKLKNAFLAVINTEPDNERTIARNAERVVWRACVTRSSSGKPIGRPRWSRGVDRLGTLLFHKALGSYKEKSVAD